MRFLLMLLLVLSFATPALAEGPALPDADVVTTSDVTPDDVTEPVALDVVAEPVTEVVVPVDPAPEIKVPTTDEEAGTIIGQLLDAATNGHWTVFVGFLLLMLMWLFNRMGLAAKIGRDYVPWVTVGLGLVACVAIGLATGANIWDALKAGFLEGGIAISLWELIFKRFTATKTDGTPRVEPVEG